MVEQSCSRVPRPESAIGAFLDTPAGAAAVRLSVCLTCTALFIQKGGHWLVARHAFGDAAAVLLALSLLALVIQPLSLIYYVLFEVGLFALKSADAVLFRVPHWILRERCRLRALPAFAIAFAFEAAVLVAAGFWSAPYFHGESPPRLGWAACARRRPGDLRPKTPVRARPGRSRGKRQGHS